MFRMYLINTLSPYCVPNRMEEIIQSVKFEESSINQPSGVQSAQTTQLLAGMTVAESKIENLCSVITGILSERKADELTPQLEEQKKASDQAGNVIMEFPDFERIFKRWMHLKSSVGIFWLLWWVDHRWPPWDSDMVIPERPLKRR